MSFEIRFKTDDESTAFDRNPGQGIEGRITIGDFWESFFAATSSCTISFYESSWTENLAALKNGDNAFFLTDVGEPEGELLFRCWPAFHHEGSIFFTEKLLLRSNAGSNVDVGDVSELIAFDELKRVVGSGVSFWKLPLAEI